MVKSSGAVVLILGGVTLVYLGATGYFASAWAGLKGDCAGGTQPAPTGDAKPTSPSPAKAGDANGGRALGRGRGGAVSNLPTVQRGGYYPSPTGALMASDMGVW